MPLDIAHETGYAAELQLIDLAEFASVNAFAARLKNDPVDILVANAAVIYPQYEATKDGWEEMYVSLCRTHLSGLLTSYRMQVNVISPSILALLLLPLMVRTSRERHTIPRTVTVTSSMHYYVPPYGDEIFLQP